MCSKSCGGSGTLTIFRDRVRIEQDSSADGSPIENFSGTPFKTSVSANIVDVNGDETYRGRQIEARMSHVVEMRYFAGVTTKMRLSVIGGVYKDRTFNIDAVKIVRKDGRVPMQWLYCSEIVDV